MVSKTGMTILDYFQLAGFKRDLSKSDPADASTLKHNSSNFRQILTAAGNKFRSPSENSDPSGLSLADYFNTRVPAIKITSPAEVVAAKSEKTEPVKKIAAMPEEELESPFAISKDSPEPDDNAAAVMEKIQAGIEKAATRYGLPTVLIQGVIRAESNFQVHAVSTAGAQGLMQLMPATARELGVEDAFDIEANVDGGSRYLKQMLDQFGDIKLALAAYNSGPATVKRYGGIPPYQETRSYVDRVMTYMEKIDYLSQNLIKPS